MYQQELRNGEPVGKPQYVEPTEQDTRRREPQRDERRSKQLERGEPQAARHGTHWTTADKMANQEPRLRQFIAGGLWLVSYAGNVLGFGRGALGFDTHTLIVCGVSLIWQLLCSYIQFVCAKTWYRNLLWWLALAASFGPSFVGYRPLIAVKLAEKITGVPGDLFATPSLLTSTDPTVMLWHIITMIVMAIFLLAVDIIPERTFLKH